MSYASAVAALETRLRTTWTASPIYLETDIVQRPNPPAAFLLLDFEDSTSRVAAIGEGPMVRHSGAMTITVYRPEADGPGAVRAMQEAVAAVFGVGAVYGGARCGAAGFGRVLTASGDVGWLVADVVVPFQVDVHHAPA